LRGRDEPDRSRAIGADVETAAMVAPMRDGEAILRRVKREISILVAREEVTITHARYAAGERIGCVGRGD